MFKMNKENQTDINETALVKSFQNEMENVLASAKSWYGNEYKTANEKLHDMFADLYRIYDTLVDTRAVGTTAKSDWIEAEVKKLNVDAIVGLAITTSFHRNDWDNQTSIDEIDDNGLLNVAEMAEEYCEWVGLTDVSITKENVKEAIWGEC